MKPSTVQPGALKPFAGLSKALRGLTKVHSYTMDLGFALGLLDQCGGEHLEFCVDGSGYRPARLPKAEWNDIANSSRFCLKPKYHKRGIFHSKAWLCKKGLLLGSANLSIREARENLNFWCWVPGGKWDVFFRYLDGGESRTIILNLNDDSCIITNTPLDALRRALKGKHMSNMVIVSPERPSRGILRKMAPFLAEQGNCCTFLRTESHAIKTLPRKSCWKVRNYIPLDKSIGLHGKAMYGEWLQDEGQGAVLYLGSANFTKQGYFGGNIESGMLIKAEGTAQVKKLQDALLSLLGRAGTRSHAQKAWATERFDGRWHWVKPPDKDVEEKENQYQNQDDIDRCLFNSRLKAKLNQLFFPSKYGTKEIIQAELSGYGDFPQIWKKPAKRRFASVFWSPALKLVTTDLILPLYHRSKVPPSNSFYSRGRI